MELLFGIIALAVSIVMIVKFFEIATNVKALRKSADRNIQHIKIDVAVRKVFGTLR